VVFDFALLFFFNGLIHRRLASCVPAVAVLSDFSSNFSSPCPCSFKLHWPCSSTPHHTFFPFPLPGLSQLSNQAFGSFFLHSAAGIFSTGAILATRTYILLKLRTTFWPLRLFTTEQKVHESRCQESIDVTLSSHCRPQHLVAPRRYYDTSHVQSFFTSCPFPRAAAALAQREFPVRSLPFLPSSLCISQCCSNAPCASHSTPRFQLVGSALHCRFRPES
jgi:hypothetical protein